MFLICLLNSAAINDPPRLLGCFFHAPDQPILRAVFYKERERNSPDHCVRTCRWAGFAFAGITYGFMCYCDHQMPVIALPSSHCQEKRCPGNSQETCGGQSAINIYATGVVAVNARTLGKSRVNLVCCIIVTISFYKTSLTTSTSEQLTSQTYRIQLLFLLHMRSLNFFLRVFTVPLKGSP